MCACVLCMYDYQFAATIKTLAPFESKCVIELACM